MSDDLEDMGPIDYLVVEFPHHRMTGEAFTELLNLVDRGIIRILDLRFVRREADGSVIAMAVSDFDGMLAVFEGASSGLLSSEDLDEAGATINPGSAAGILVYENVWAAPFATALRRVGGQLVASGRIPIQAMLAAIEETDAGAGGSAVPSRN